MRGDPFILIVAVWLALAGLASAQVENPKAPGNEDLAIGRAMASIAECGESKLATYISAREKDRNPIKVSEILGFITKYCEETNVTARRDAAAYEADPAKLEAFILQIQKDIMVRLLSHALVYKLQGDIGSKLTALQNQK